MRETRGIRLARLLTVLLLLGTGGPLAAQSPPLGRDDGGAADPGEPRLPELDAENVPEALLAEVGLLLSGVHGAPDRLLLEAQLPAARELLLLVAREPDLLPLQRGQALWALAQWGGDEVVAVCRAVLDEGDPVLVHDALLLLGRVGGEAAVPVLTPWLESPDLQVRLSAIAALGESDNDEAVAALERAELVETHPVARERLARALQRVR